MNAQDIALMAKAARANGMECGDSHFIAFTDNYGYLREWNSLTSSEDAFDLAAQLSISIDYLDGIGEAKATSCCGVYEAYAPYDDDKPAAARRAVTECAAALQEAKEGV